MLLSCFMKANTRLHSPSDFCNNNYNANECHDDVAEMHSDVVTPTKLVILHLYILIFVITVNMAEMQSDVVAPTHLVILHHTVIN